MEWRGRLLRPGGSSFHLLLRQKVEPKGAHDPSGEPHHTGRHTSRSAAATRIVDTYRTHPADTSGRVCAVLREKRLQLAPGFDPGSCRKAGAAIAALVPFIRHLTNDPRGS